MLVGVGDGGCDGGSGDGAGAGAGAGDGDGEGDGSGSSSEVGGFSQFPMLMNSTRMQGKENSGIRNPGNRRLNRTLGIVGRFQSARPPTTGKTVDELSSLVVVIQVKTFESRPDTDWAPKFGGKVVIVEVSGGGEYVDSDGSEDASGGDHGREDESGGTHGNEDRSDGDHGREDKSGRDQGNEDESEGDNGGLSGVEIEAVGLHQTLVFILIKFSRNN